MSIILFFLGLSFKTAYAQGFEHEFKGRWKHKGIRHYALTIHPDHLKIRFCKKAFIRSQNLNQTLYFDYLNRTQTSKNFVLYTYGDENPHCLSRGYHECSLTIGQWDEIQDKMDLTLSCDESQFVHVYEKRIFSKRRHRR